MALQNLDLTTSYPVSVKEKLFGIVQLKRTIDKGIAAAHGNVGEYHYDCPMDKAVFAFLGLEAQPLLDVIKQARSRADIEAYVKPFVEKKSPAELEEWNAEWLKRGPAAGSEGEKYFLELRAQLAPERTDITSWPDLLDLDEKREVPRAVSA
ncbi:MAG: hypothetical protein QOI11_2235 [Candidatus Eremiobacteraeota bacterium]|jgi:hypothetical protein|nr:hypothetical protein [Candidatus Eremiobacteraeota bacterium]